MGSKNHFNAALEQCGSAHDMKILSIISATCSAVLMVFTIPINAVIIYCLVKDRKKKFETMFYKLLLNIAMADLLTGLVAEPASVNYLWKEALGVQKRYEIYVIHIFLFFTDALALVSMTILGIERILLVWKPAKHYHGINKQTKNIILISCWPIACLLVAPYFVLNYIKQLIVFTSMNMIVCSLFFLLIALTWKFLNTKRTAIYQTKTTSENAEHSSSYCSSTNNTLSEEYQPKQPSQSFNQSDSSIPRVDQLDSRKCNHKEKKSVAAKIRQNRATKSFIWMLCVFIVTYVPTCITMFYMNICKDCNCKMIHIMRDVSVRFILLSALLRPINFIFTLQHLKRAVRELF